MKSSSCRSRRRFPRAIANSTAAHFPLQLCSGSSPHFNHGLLEQIGTPEDIYLRPKTRFVAGFIGSLNWRGEYGVRPEAVRVASTAPGNGARCQPGRISSSLFLGNCFHVEARLEDGTDLVAEIPRLDQSFSPGENVHLWWHAHDEIRLPQ